MSIQKGSKKNLNILKNEELEGGPVNKKLAMDIEDFGIEVLEAPIKSPHDKKEYRVIRLKNGLTATLISDMASLKDKPDCLPPISSSHTGLHNSEEVEDEEEDEDEFDELEEEEEEDEDESREEIDERLEEMMDMTSEDRLSGVKQRQTRYLSAASLTIGAGSFEDPHDIQGLMHFLEHMVFMGSEKYSKENYFDNFIKQCGGHDNAHTDLEDTTFYFDVQEMHFEKALDVFANFFISPLMKEEAMQRERKSVHSEFQEALSDDECRKQQIFSTIASEGHPMSRFTFGNEKTLQLNISDKELHTKLHQLRERYYTAQFMTLAVQAREPLDKLQDMVVRIFSKIHNNGLSKPSYEMYGFPFSNQENFHKLYKIIPVSDHHILDINWALPSLLKYYEYKPLHYISYLIGHEGKGSIISYLKKRIWAVEICSGNDESGFDHNSTYAVFNISIRLTDKGFQNLDKVLLVVFQYLKLLNEEGVNERIFSEIQKVEQINFDYAEESNSSENVTNISEDMQLYPSKHILSGGSLIYKYDPSIIMECLRKLNPRSCNIMVNSKSYEKSKTVQFLEEEWFGTKYCVEDLPKKWVSSWEDPEENPEFHIPFKNEYIPDDFEVLKRDDPKESPPQYPKVIIEKERGRLWFKQDFKFCRPKAYCYIYFYLGFLPESPIKAGMLDLFINLFTQLIMEAVYPATLAQYVTDIKTSDMGFVIKVSGFNQKIQKCVELLLSEIKKLEDNLEPTFFREMINLQMKSYLSSIINADVLRRDIRLSILQESHWIVLRKMKSIVDLTIAEFVKGFLHPLYQKSFIEVLVQGNLTEESAESLFKSILDVADLSFPPIPRQKASIRKVRNGENYVRVKSLNPASSNSSVINYYQGERLSLKKEVLNEFVVMAMDEPVFDALRTKDQLGYHVYCTSRNTDGILGISITVNSQANKHSVTYINERIEVFLKMFLKSLKVISEDEVKILKETLKNFKLTVDHTLKDEVDRNWEEIVSNDFLFARHVHQLQIIPSITLDDAVNYLNDMVSPSSEKYRKLSIQVEGSSKPAEGKVPTAEELIKKSAEDAEQAVTLLTPTEEDLKLGIPAEQFVTELKTFVDQLNLFEVEADIS